MTDAHLSGRRVDDRGPDSEDALADVAALLEDEYARSIIRYTSERARSARELMDLCDASKATVYRRVDRLREYDLLESYQEYDPDGHHYQRFAATLDRLTVTCRDGEFDLSFERTRDPADRTADRVEDLD